MSHDLNLAPMLALIAGGLALFLFGLELMTAGLKAVAGSGLQTALAKLTADRFRGLLAGAFVTALLNFLDNYHRSHGWFCLGWPDDIKSDSPHDHGR
jgi:Na+/Pi-cotransporter